MERCTTHLNFICVFTVVSNAFLALESTQYLCYDAIIVKEDLPNFGALALFKILKTVGASVGGIVLYNREREVSKTLDESLGVRSFLPKPFSSFELGAAITSAIGADGLRSISMKNANVFELPANTMMMKKIMPQFAFAPPLNIVPSVTQSMGIQKDISMTVEEHVEDDENSYVVGNMLKATARHYDQQISNYSETQASKIRVEYEQYTLPKSIGRKRTLDSVEVPVQRALSEKILCVGKSNSFGENVGRNKRFKITSMNNAQRKNDNESSVLLTRPINSSFRRDSFDDESTTTTSSSVCDSVSDPESPIISHAAAPVAMHVSDSQWLSSHTSFDSLSSFDSFEIQDDTFKKISTRSETHIQGTANCSDMNIASYLDSEEFRASLELLEDISDDSLRLPYFF